ncbi:hypothetical protein CFOL_v3_30951 [Cephalotus follicularis]|uniref:Uncharacterized protein n=1 Tax=Cephalotus follicularis TaxID=3775 RepID=A0A1Q3D4Y6_CEPFO|nr:hypothetical protein CFOL_v3_30951 [Cephalotus follicularis]
MEIMPSTYYHNLKRFWRRKKYRRLNGTNNKKKLKVARLGGVASPRLWKKRTLKLGMKIASPIKILAKCHDAYINMMIRMANNVGTLSYNGLFKGKKVAGDQNILTISKCGEVIDNRLVMEIYKRKILAKCHDAYINMMIRMANNVGTLSYNGLFKGKKVAGDQNILTISKCGEVIDNRLVMEIYKSLAASRDLSVI